MKAVDDVSFEIRRGETLGLVGSRAAARRPWADPPPPHRADRRPDRVRRGGHHPPQGRDLKRYRRRMQIVFQDPYASLDPRPRSPRPSGGAPDPRHRDAAGARGQGGQMMDLVGLQPYHARRYPTSSPAASGSGSGRPGARPRAGPARLRRAGERPRRQHPGPGPEPAPRPPAPAGPDLPVHRPQHGRGRAHQRPGRGHVPRCPGRGRRRRRDLPPPGPPVHHRPAVRGPGGQALASGGAAADHPPR